MGLFVFIGVHSPLAKNLNFPRYVVRTFMQYLS
jgi:hypothetical protein